MSRHASFFVVGVCADGSIDILTSHSSRESAVKVMNLLSFDSKFIDFKIVAGADLSLAVLHRTKLPRAKLDGAKLDGANLNKTDLKNASLAQAKLTEALQRVLAHRRARILVYGSPDRRFFTSAYPHDAPHQRRNSAAIDCGSRQ